MASTSGPTAVTNLYSTGTVQSTGYILDGEMHGHWEFFRKDGSMMRSGEFDRGTQIGIWRTYDRSGRMVKETAFATRG
jgi:antitoxin component YwqK of YwqJK toxin-antitoxin module